MDVLREMVLHDEDPLVAVSGHLLFVLGVALNKCRLKVYQVYLAPVIEL